MGKERERGFAERAGEYFVNEGPKLVFVGLWIVANIVLFGKRYYDYYQRKEAFELLGHGVCVAKACAAVIKLNSVLLLATVLRNILSWIRGSVVGSYIPVDKNIVFHRYIASAIAVFAVAHTVAHYFNFLRVSKASISTAKSIGFSVIPTTEYLAYLTIPGITGIVLSVVMVLMYSSAVKRVRGSMFNVFWFTHHLFILYIILLCIHGIHGIVDKNPTAYQWLIAPTVIYIAERTARILRGNQSTVLLAAIAHPSKVLELKFSKLTFNYLPGQYLFLNCPFVASQEWHPFTITSAPEEDFVSVHVRIVGDWTGALWSFLNPSNKLGLLCENVRTAPTGEAIFRIDGPYGAASEGVFDYKVVMLVAGGIGVTPFGSILKSIRYKIEMLGSSTYLEKVYFFWISRDKGAFEWFNEVLMALEQDNVNNFLEIHTYLTAPMKLNEIRNLYDNSNINLSMNSNDVEMQQPYLDQINGLQSPTNFGRPNFNQILTNLATVHSGTRIGVFFCGPAVLSKQLYKQCLQNSINGTKFVFHKENF